MSEPKKKSERFKYTRELVNIALNDGMTQEDIKKLCRTTQSVVSAWKSGESKAQLHVIGPLLARYGNRLNRTTARVYLVESPSANAPQWAETDQGRALLQIREDHEAQTRRGFGQPLWFPHKQIAGSKELVEHLFGSGEKSIPLEMVIKVAEEEFDARQRPPKIVRVDGPIVLRHSFRNLMTVLRGPRLELEQVPVARWIIHHQQRGRFVLVCQRRRKLTGVALFRWKEAIEQACETAKEEVGPGDFGHSDTDITGVLRFERHARPFVDSADDAGRWIARIEGPLEVADLLGRTDALIADPQEVHGPHDEITLPFLIRKMLVDEGYAVPGVEHVPSYGYDSLPQTPTTQEDPHGKALPPDARKSSA